ncbi:MAG: hypothetical protein ACLFSQ_08410 [Candidatus Zixiibacteriota bacterium]
MKKSIRSILISILIISAFSVEVGNPGEDVHIGGDKTGVNVDTAVPPAAVFEVFSEDDGILIPRLTISQRDAISSPENGLLIYNLDCGNFNYYNGANWIPFPNLMPFTIDPISGDGDVCQNATEISYAIPSYTEAISYNWSVPDGATIASGSGTNSITVDFGTSSGEVCVLVTTDCGSASRCKAITLSPETAPGTVSGGGTIELGESTGMLALSGYTGSVLNWQRRLDGGAWTNISHTSDVYSETPSSSGTWDYRSHIQSGVCPSAYSDYATVIVNPSSTGDSAVFNYSGSIETWNVPGSVYSIEIECWGAQGGTGGGSSSSEYFTSIGGKGARMEGTFSVIPGTTLRILVGEQGVDINYYTTGGGGGSFVWEDGSTTPMIIAGGGGGGGGRGAVNYLGIDAETTEDGTDGNNAPGGAGTGGYGGVAVPDGSMGYGAGGCGWYSNGADGNYSSYTSAEGGTRPLEGGAGGEPGGSTTYNTRGGFGGGGGAQGAPNTAGGGGGGGYSGGGGGKRESLPEGYQYSGGGGGGSFNAGTDQDNSPGVREGNGRVVIRW